jgi:hypothetical protein
MKRVETRIKTSFGEIVVEGENAEEVLGLLRGFPEGFVESVGEFVSSKVVPGKAQLKGVVEFTTQGPVIIARENLTHY